MCTGGGNLYDITDELEESVARMLVTRSVVKDIGCTFEAG